MVKFVCLQCEKIFQSKKRHIGREPKYCCRKCFQNRTKEAITIQKMSDAKKGKSPWNKGIAMWEGKQHPRGTLGKPSKRKGSKLTASTIQKLRDSHTGLKYPSRAGEKSRFWKGGITPKNEVIRKSSEYKFWRNKVFERDDYTCQSCKKRGGNLNADHILPFSLHPEKRLDIENGRTLCFDCHLETETYGIKIRKNQKDYLANLNTMAL